MKKYEIDNGATLFDINGEMLLQTAGDETIDTVHWIKAFPCNGWSISTTKRGRKIIRLSKGNHKICTIFSGNGDRSWNNWEEYQKMLAHSAVIDNVLSMAFKDSNGGGCWIEVHIFPNELQDDLTERPMLGTLSTDLADAI